MKLHIINSNSQGNAYILYNEQEALLIECGLRFDRIKNALGYDLRKVVGCLVTHEHNDHSKAIVEVMNAGIDVYASAGTHEAKNTLAHHRAKVVRPGEIFRTGNFMVQPFDVKHDCAEPLGFLIRHNETGTILFLTDSYYTEYRFKGLNQVIIEANFCENIIKRKVQEGASPKFLKDRVLQSHMSLQTCKQTLSANDLSGVANIVLIHLSDSNSDAARFKTEVEQHTGKVVYVADANMTIDFNLSPF
jgi:phosphoribosyl 1,2-cyclic phosphodiesterase